MKNYSEFSDFEINKAVAIASGLKIKEYPSDGSPLIWHWVKNENGNEFFDYIDYKDFCNNPSDAWPIIKNSEISILKDNGLHLWCATSSAYWADGSEWQIGVDAMDCNPLRAAMIMYLMMKDNENEN